MAFFRTIQGSLSIGFIVVNTAFAFLCMLPLGLIKRWFPSPAVQVPCLRLCRAIGRTWISINNLTLWLVQRPRWVVEGLDTLPPAGWPLVIANHQSWVDIVILQNLFNRRIPFLCFLMKDQLKKVPLLGFCWQALDYPFLKRSSSPQDTEALRRSFRLFQNIPSTIVNFVEGSRFSEKKKAFQQSPFRHLLLPKTSGLRICLEELRERMEFLFDVTIVYRAKQFSFWDFLCGRLRHVRIRIRSFRIPPLFLQQEAFADPATLETFRAWLYEIWAEKDAWLGTCLAKTGT